MEGVPRQEQFMSNLDSYPTPSVTPRIQPSPSTQSTSTPSLSSIIAPSNSHMTVLPTSLTSPATLPSSLTPASALPPLNTSRLQVESDSSCTSSPSVHHSRNDDWHNTFIQVVFDYGLKHIPLPHLCDELKHFPISSKDIQQHLEMFKLYHCQQRLFRSLTHFRPQWASHIDPADMMDRGQDPSRQLPGQTPPHQDLLQERSHHHVPQTFIHSAPPSAHASPPSTHATRLPISPSGVSTMTSMLTLSSSSSPASTPTSTTSAYGPSALTNIPPFVSSSSSHLSQNASSPFVPLPAPFPVLVRSVSSPSLADLPPAQPPYHHLQTTSRRRKQGSKKAPWKIPDYPPGVKILQTHSKPFPS
eukprot:GILI01035924.1.p1 GENE.GILI01035924.1~~GILI01035924.1.p1  ORF type:complete len:411 (-),score=21.71 GILI01035924.1:230-1306(-)